jgi:hypothetical protein
MERKIISHRANLNGPNLHTENTINAISNAINMGFDVEIDVWYENKILYLGHDYDKKIIYENLLQYLLFHEESLWIHCKNIDALIYLKNFDTLNTFGHDVDNYVLTSKLNLFCKPGYPSNKNSVIVMPELSPIYKTEDFFNCYGVCTDYPLEIKENKFDRFCQVTL